MFRKTIEFAIGALNQAKQSKALEDFLLIGGVAVSAWSVPRATADVDFVIKLASSLNASEILTKHLKARFRPGDIGDPLRGVFEVNVPDGNPVQLVWFPPKLEEIMFQDPESIVMQGLTIPIASPVALIISKLYAGGPQDLADVRALMISLQSKPALLDRVRLLAKDEGLDLLLGSLVSS